MTTPITDPEMIKQLEESAGKPQGPLPKVVSKFTPPEEPTEVEDENYWLEVLKNQPSSLFKLYHDMTAIAKPETWKGMGNLIMGLQQKLAPHIRGPEEHYAEAVGKHYKDRYGTWERIKQTFKKDPYGVLSDASMVGGATSGVLRAASVADKSGKVAKIAEQAGKASAIIDPTNVVWDAAVRPVARGAARAVSDDKINKLYESGAKFTTGTVGGKDTYKIRKGLTETALEEGFTPVPKDLRKMNKTIEDLESQLSGAIKKATAKYGDKVHVNDLLKHIDGVKKEYGGARFEAPQALDVINNLEQRYLNHVNDTGRAWLTAAELQDIKVDNYNKIYSDTLQQKTFDAKDAARSAVARSAREEIEAMTPEVKAINQRLGRLYELRGPLAKSAARIENRSLVDMGEAMKIGSMGGAGYMIGGEFGGKIGTGLGAALTILDKPQVKTRLATTLAKAKRGKVLDIYDNSLSRAQVRNILSEIGQLDEVLKQKNGQK